MPVDVHDKEDSSRDAMAEALKQAAVSIGKKGLMEFLVRASKIDSKKGKDFVGAVLVNHRAHDQGTVEEKAVAERRLLETFYGLVINK